jgi:hypothetical protein
MMADLRERLAVLDDASAPDLWAEIEGRPPRLERLIHPSRGRRISAAFVALAVAVGGTILAVSTLSPDDSDIETSSWTAQAVPRLRLTFRHPPDWHVQSFDEQVGHVEFAGAVVSNVAHTFRHPDLGPNEVTSAWSLRGLPETAVAISIERVIGGPTRPEPLPDTDRPIDLEGARLVRMGGGWEERSMPIVVGGGSDYVRVWFGPEASERDKKIARRIVGSIEPFSTSGPNAEERIAFSAYSAGHWQIFSAQPDGSERTQLTSPSTDHFHPAWSPDGRKIVFSAQNAGGDNEIHVMNADGSNIVQLTKGPGWSYLPAWSPDASRIAFVSNREGNDEIYVMDADGSDQTRLTDDPDEDLSPVWSPDGTRIAFQSNRTGGNEIFVMAPDGTRIRNLTDEPGSGEFDPAWSPDGTMIAFASDRDGNPEIYVMNADGSGATRLTTDPAHDWSPAWAPDGLSLAFESDRDGGTALYVMELDGSEPVRLTGTETDTCCPTWQSTTSVE